MQKTYQLVPPCNEINNEFGPYEFKEVSIPIAHYRKRKWVVLNRFMQKLDTPLNGLFMVIKGFIKRDKLTLINEAVFIYNEHSLNYFHWINDMLPKLEYASTYFSNHTVVLPDNFKNREYIIESLLLFDLKIHFIKDKELVFINKIIDLDDLNNSGTQNPEFLIPAIEKLKSLPLTNSSNGKILKYLFLEKTKKIEELFH